MKTRLFATLSAFLLSGSLTTGLWAGPVHAAVFFEDSFEGASVDASGWGWSGGYCQWSPGSRPCPFLDLSTDVAHAGSKSLKGTYNAAWSDPNPQTNTQAIGWGFAPQTNLYVRYWYRTSGFTYSAAAGTKHIYWKGNPGSPNFFSINWFGSRSLGFAGQTPNENFYPNMASVPFADNVWYCVEEHVKLNTPGVADGMVEIWVNGVQTLGHYNRTFRGTLVNGPDGNSSTMTFSFIEIYKQNGDGLMYYDQVAVGNSRIGCGGAVPAGDTTPPAPPVGLVVR